MPSRACACSLPDTAGEQPLLAGLKHLNRLEQVLARAEWQDSEHAEGLMRDRQGA
jgi:4-amino-4-deoxychorismate lyase